MEMFDSDRKYGEKLRGSRLGYWAAQRKLAKTVFAELLELCRDTGVSAQELNMAVDAPSGVQSSTVDAADAEAEREEDCVLHHVSDFLAKIKDGDVETKPQLDRFNRYLNRHPKVKVVDPLAAVRRLTNRYKTCRLIRQQLSFGDVGAPPFALMKSSHDLEDRVRLVRSKGLSFPLVAKSVQSHRHDMEIVFNEQGLNSLDCLRFPVLLQTFVPHDGILFKVFVIGDNHWVVRRPSLRNLRAGVNQPNQKFSTYDVSKRNSNHVELNGDRGQVDGKAAQSIEPDDAKVEALVKMMTSATQLTLYGIDLVLETTTGRHYIIDINYFPGYEGVERVGEHLFEHLSQYLRKGKENRQVKKTVPLP